jgi:hypothetical protein
MKTTCTRLSFALMALALLAGHSPALAHAASYSFVKIVDTNTPRPGGGFFQNPIIDGGSLSTGTVAFEDSLGLWTGSGGPLTNIFNNGDSTPLGNASNPGVPAMDNGVIAFGGGFGSRTGMYKIAGGVITPIAQNGDPAPSGTFVSMATESGPNNRPRFDSSGGTVAFRADYGSPIQDGIFAGGGVGLTTIVKDGDPAPVGTFNAVSEAFSAPSISGPNVAFTGRYSSTPNNGRVGLFVGSGGPLTQLLKTGDPAPIGTYDIINAPSIDGNVVAAAVRYQGMSGLGQSIVTLSTGGGGPTTIVQSTDTSPWGGTFSNMDLAFTHPSLVGGHVAFVVKQSAVPLGGRQGVFVGNGGSLMTIIKNGDPLFGGTLFSLEERQVSLDGAGTRNVAFTYQLTDGTRGIAMAVFIPEPATAGMLLGGVAALAAVRRRRARLAS